MTLYSIFPSPIGPLLVTSDGENITRLFMESYQGSPKDDAGFALRNPGDHSAGLQSFGIQGDASWSQADHQPLIIEARNQLDAYFAGRRRTFALPLAPSGSAFQQRVWEELTRISFGTAISYGELARRVGNPAASRAVGLANGKNPISIIVPCHRVIGASGKLTGYGGGLDRKEWLLKHEGIPLKGTQQELLL